MGRREAYLEENVDLIKGQSGCVSACTRGTRRILAYKNVRKFLKELLKKENGGDFASGLARKPPFFQSLSR